MNNIIFTNFTTEQLVDWTFYKWAKVIWTNICSVVICWNSICLVVICWNSIGLVVIYWNIICLVVICWNSSLDTKLKVPENKSSKHRSTKQYFHACSKQGNMSDGQMTTFMPDLNQTWSKPWILKDVIISSNPWQHFMSWSKPQRRIVFREAVIHWRLSPLDPNNNDPSHNWFKPWILKDVIISSHPDNFHPLGLYRCQLIIGQLNRKNINWLFVQWYALFSSLLFNWHIYQLTFVPV